MKTAAAILLSATLLGGEADPLISRDLRCLADAVYWETRGVEAQGASLVADVVMNRVAHTEFPDSVCAVVLQPHQFAAAIGRNYPILEPDAYEDSMSIAANAYMAEERDHDALFFINDSIGMPNWARSLAFVTRVGDHIFMTIR
ncbi:MAG: hypothetical protein GVY13_05275 [Alphaproteobacteria bacterium]|jgi:spore germination cell wall hydrolase CwlJ-like protein|nr:hypothetical protein [Alphaproteobacteria bacterium]